MFYKLWAMDVIWLKNVHWAEIFFFRQIIYVVFIQSLQVFDTNKFQLYFVYAKSVVQLA